jgi:hypothetical protein
MLQQKAGIESRAGKVFAAIFFGTAASLVVFFSPHSALAATCTASNGNWSSAGIWSCGHVPLATDDVVIPNTNGVNVTVDTAAVALTVTFTGGNRANAITVSGTNSLTVTNAVTINAPTGAVTKQIAVGAGTLSAGSMSITSGTAANRISQVTLSTGTINVTGNITFGGTASAARLTFSGAGILNVGGAGGIGSGGTFTASTGTVNYNGAAQAVRALAYYNLIFSGSGAKSVVTGTSVSGNLSIAPTGSATASIGAGLNISVGTLTVGGLGTINGTWGSTSSSATHKNDVYFAATTGILTVATDSRGSQATLTAVATPSTITYGVTSTLSTTGGSGSGAVTFSVGASTGCSVAGTTLTATDVSGTCNVTATKAADEYYLSATSAPLAVTLANPVPVVTSISPTSTGAGGPQFTLTVNGSNFVTGSVIKWNTSSVTTTFVSSVQLTAAIPAAYIAAVGSASVTVFNPTPGGGTSDAQTFTIYSLPVASFSLSHPGTMDAKSRVGYTVTRRDQYGNLVTNGTTTVYLYTNSTSTNAKFYNDSSAGSQITFINIPNGQNNVAFWYYDDQPGAVTITASDATPVPDGATGITDATDSIVVLPVAVKFVIIQPSNGTVDSPIAVTIQAQKPDNSVDTNYQSDVTLSLSGSATTTGAGLVDIINGVGTKNISDTVAETVNLSLTDSQGTGLDVSSTKTVTFSAGNLAQYSLSDPGTIGAGTRASYTVTRKDQYGNLITSGTSAVYLYTNSSSSQAKFYPDATSTSSITSVTIGSGQFSASFYYYDQALGSWTVTASDNATAPDGNTGVIDAMDSITVIPGAVSQFVLSHSPAITVGTRAAYTVQRMDVFGNLVTSGSTNVYLYSSSVSTSSAFYLSSSGGSPTTLAAINDGFSDTDFWYEDGAVGVYTITASDNATAPDGNTGIADATDSLTVSPAPIVATRLVILDPGSGTADAAVTVTVQAQDNSGSVDTTFNGTVTLNTTGSATGGGAVTIASGVGTKDISDTVAQTVTLTLTDTGGTGLDVSSSKTLTFAPGALAQFSVSSPGDMAAGTRQALTVARKDQFGNGVISGLTVAYLYSASSNPNMRFYNAASGGSAITFMNLSDGVSTTQVWYYDETAATTTVTVSDNATSPDGLTGVADASAFVHVIPGATAKYVISDPGAMFAGTRAPYTVTRKDQFDNPVISGVDVAYLWSNSTGVNKKFYDSATGGLIVTSAAIDNTYSSANFWYYDDQAGTWTVTASNNPGGPTPLGGFVAGTDSITVSLVPIVATRFVILPVGPVQIGTPAQVIIQAEDNSGNIQTDYNNSVTLNVTGSATGGGVVNVVNGIGIASVNDFTAETVALSLTDSAGTGLDVSSTQSLIFSSTPVLQPGFIGGTPAQPAKPVVGGVTLAGVAYPGAKVSIVALGETAAILKQSTVASPLGRFQIDFRGISVGARSYGLVVQDKEGRVSQSRTFDVNLKNASDILQVTNILASPTIGFSRATVTKGDRLIVVGYSTPNSTVTFKVDGKDIVERTQAGADGAYRILLRTGELSLGSHTIAALQQDALGRFSDPSIQKVFNVTNLLVPQVDFNGDGKINVIDASIFLSRFNSPDPKIKLLDDLNGDRKVDASDFSIFLRTLRLQ